MKLLIALGVLATLLSISSPRVVFALASETAGCIGIGSSTVGPLGLRDDAQRNVTSLPIPGLFLREFAWLHEGSFHDCGFDE